MTQPADMRASQAAITELQQILGTVFPKIKDDVAAVYDLKMLRIEAERTLHLVSNLEKHPAFAECSAPLLLERVRNLAPMLLKLDKAQSELEHLQNNGEDRRKVESKLKRLKSDSQTTLRESKSKINVWEKSINDYDKKYAALLKIEEKLAQKRLHLSMKIYTFEETWLKFQAFKDNHRDCHELRRAMYDDIITTCDNKDQALPCGKQGTRFKIRNTEKESGNTRDMGSTTHPP